jgi:FtsP/CotA-like multicopper oxidase with cupredoxin domain
VEGDSVKKVNNRTVNSGQQPRSLNHQGTNHWKAEGALPPGSRQHSTGKAVKCAAAVAVAAFIALSLLDAPVTRAQNLGSPPFANPHEVHYRAREKRLHAILELSGGQYTIPGVGKETLRQFRGWDPAGYRPNFGNDLGPGPTLRARLGDLVEISFLNKIDDSQFPYTFDTDSKPGRSSFGCDKSGNVYPGKDIFPNCFHGSSTANLHFHGTHTSPDGLSDNVLVQILPQVNQPDWTHTFNEIFKPRKVPQKWHDLPEPYRNKQLEMIGDHDKEAAEQAKKNGLQPPEPLLEKDLKMIDAGLWPQYLMGAFPNFFVIPEYDPKKDEYKAGQAPGTHWYHAHKHGSTSQDIFNGLAGALIIESNHEGGYDHVIRKYYKWGSDYRNHEKIFVFQQFDSTQNLERTVKGKGSKQVLVNGKLTPTITMMAGEVQLWRFVNATEGNTQGIITGLQKNPGFTFKQTAQDGVQFSPYNYENQPFLSDQVPGGFALAAGNRADVLVQAPLTAGVVTFRNNPTGTNPGAILFFVEVKCATDSGGKCIPDKSTPNPPFPTAWPKIPDFLVDLPTPGPKDIPNPDTPVKFQWEPLRTGGGLLPANPPSYPPHFMINGKQFEETGPKVDQCMPLNGLQDWVLENYTTIPHPFHIHINPFQVIKIETPVLIDSNKPASNDNVKYTTYAPKDNFIWQDVIALTNAIISTDGKQIWPGKITIRQKYLDFTGTFVLHCHILAHEDRGMMQLVRVVPANQYPGACQANLPEHH